jgi:hypothetical protein
MKRHLNFYPSLSSHPFARSCLEQKLDQREWLEEKERLEGFMLMLTNLSSSFDDTSKAIGNAIKAKGLTKLRFYCQVCEKACRDENGYKCHIESESHMRQIAVLGPNAGKTINNFSQQFQDGFVQLLSRR